MPWIVRTGRAPAVAGPAHLHVREARRRLTGAEQELAAYDPAVAIRLSDDLIQLETKAWEEIQAKALTVETAEAVQAAITAYAEETGQSRYDVEMELKFRVRNPEGYEERDRKRREAEAKK